MPEAPEVEILKTQLKSAVIGKRVQKIEINNNAKSTLPKRTPELLKQARVIDVMRFGKLLVIHFDVGLSLTIHLMMVGQLRLWRTSECIQPQTELVLQFEKNKIVSLSHVSLRHVHLIPTQALARQTFISRMGLDVLSPNFTFKTFEETLESGKGKIKPFLINQTYLAGIGNTYADEILFSARLDPQNNISKFQRKHMRKLFDAIRTELLKGIELAGSSEMNFVDLYGSSGRYQKQFQVKRRKDQPCFRCRTKIKRILVSGRGSYYCPTCQVLL